jgi:hypothetical protein
MADAGRTGGLWSSLIFFFYGLTCVKTLTFPKALKQGGSRLFKGTVA